MDLAAIGIFGGRVKVDSAAFGINRLAVNFLTEILRNDDDGRPVTIAMIAEDEGEVILYDVFRVTGSRENAELEYREVKAEFERLAREIELC